MGLCLARKLGQIIYIGKGENRVSVQYYKRSGDQIWLDITAPDHIVIDRKEIAERKKIEGFKSKEQLQQERDNKGNR